MVSDQELAITSKTLRARAELCAAEKDWAGAARFSRRMLMLRPASAVSWRFFAAVSDRLGDFGSIVKGFRRALLVNPASPTLTHDFALVERQNDRHAAAFQLCRRSICAAPQTINGYLTAGATAYDKSKLDRAWPMFLRARTIQPDNLTALANIVRVLVLRGHHGLIGRAARRWLCADPTAKGAGATLASAWTSIVRLGEAIKIARRTLLDTPLHGRLLGTLARAELKTGAYDKAIESARRYALINPSSGYALLTLSEASVGRQDLSLCEISSNWLRVVASDRGKEMAAAVAHSGRPSVFVHIPKTAGTSIQRSTYAFATSIGHRWIEETPTEEDKHYTVWVAPNLLIDKADLDKQFVFSNTRHLLPMLVSFYEHCRRGFSSPSMIDLCRIARAATFDDFIRRIAAQDTPWISRRFIFAPFFERSSGRFLIDWLNRTEAVDDDLPEMCRLRRFAYRGVEQLNKEVNSEWRGYYTDDLVDLAWRVWAREVALFGFTRDGGYTEDAPLHRDVSRFKARLDYDWRDDILRLDGKVFDGRSAVSLDLAAAH